MTKTYSVLRFLHRIHQAEIDNEIQKEVKNRSYTLTHTEQM